MAKKIKRKANGELVYERKWTDVLFDCLNYSIFLLFTISCIFPFYYIFINTISDADLVVGGKITLFHQGINFQNYVNMMKVNAIGQAFLVTIARTLLGNAGMVVATGLTGYLVTKKELWGRRAWSRLLVITMYFNAGIIPWYMNMSMLGLTGNFLAYIIPGIVAPYNIILVKTYIESIPAELEESAFMDGASYIQVFTKIIWPLSKPILATIAIFGAVGHWNSFTDSLILMQNNSTMFTLQHLLYNYLNMATDLEGQITAADIENFKGAMANAKVMKYTVSMISVIPILLVYPFMQRYFEKGIMLGAVKG